MNGIAKTSPALASVLAAMLATAAVPPALARDACPAAPPPVSSLDLTRFYADKEGSTVDPALAEQHKAETEPLTRFLREVTSDADKSLKRTKPGDQVAAAECALEWLAAWARAGALLGRMGTKQAEYERKWDMTGAALAYIKLKPVASDAQRQTIEPWLVKLADASRAFFDDPTHKRNNHWYWLGLGLGAVAIAADSRKHWEMARAIMQDGARDIAPDGSLPQELARGKRALHYHGFALMPLAALAELGRARGEDFYGFGNGALMRLADLTARGHADPAVFEKLAGVAQEQPVKPGAGWAQLLALRNPALAGKLPAMPPGHRWLGGDVLLLAETLNRRTP